MKKTISFFTFIFVFAVLVAGAQNNIPDLSSEGEYKIPKLCISGEDSEWKFKVGYNVYTLKLMSRINLGQKYPGGSFGGLTKQYGAYDIDASTVIIPGAWLITKDNYVVVISEGSEVSEISVNEQRFGTYGGPFSEAMLTKEITKNTYNYYQNVFKTYLTVIDSSVINGVKIEIRGKFGSKFGIDSGWGTGSSCVRNLYVYSAGVTTKSISVQPSSPISVQPSSPSTVTLVEGIALPLLFEGQNYQLTFSQKGSDYQLYVKRLNPESGHIQDFKKEDVIAGKVFKVAFPRSDGKSEDLFLISFPKLKIPEDVKGYDIQTVTQVVENPQGGGKEQPFVFLSPPVPQPFIINYRNIVPKWVKLKVSEIITSETVDGRPLPVPRLDVYIIAQTVEKPKDKPVPSPGLTGAAKGAVSVSLPKQSDVNNDGSVNKEDVLFIKSNPQNIWTEKLNKDIKNLNSLIKAMIKDWAAAK